MEITKEQLDIVKELLKKMVSYSSYYRNKFKGLSIENINNNEDFKKIPFTTNLLQIIMVIDAD